MIRRCKIKDIGYFFGGLTGKNKDDFNIGNAKYVSYMTVFSNPRLPDSITDIVSISENEKQNKIQKGDVLFTGSSETPDECGMSCVVTKDVVGDVYLNSFCFGLRFHNNEILNSSYLAHYFRSNYARKQISKTANGVTRFNISKKLFSEIEIVYPSIKVQEEIVKILDSFTNLIDALNEELSLRQKQFEYYREKLLTFDDSVKKIKLEEIGYFYGGLSGKSKEDFNGGNKKFVSYMNIFTNSTVCLDIDDKVKVSEDEKQNKITYGDILFTGSSETPEECGMTSVVACDINEDIYLNSFSFGYRFNNLNGLFPKFFSFLMRSHLIRDEITKTANGVTRFNISKKLLGKVMIPIPSLSLQQSIVEKLDAFESLISSLKEEIALRQKQYEYYREKLLTFD